MIKIMSSTALLTFVRMASGFIIAKMVAVYTGPVGIAYLGQLQSFVTSMVSVSNAPLQNGLVRYTREFHEEGYEYCSPWWSSAVQWLACILIVLVPLISFFSGYISRLIFSSDEYSWLVNISALVIPFSALGTLIKSVLNGLEQYKNFVLLGITSTLISTGLILLLIYAHQLEGGLLSVALQPAVAGFTMLLFAAKQDWFTFKYWFSRTQKKHRDGIRNYILMAIISAILGPLSLMIIRKIIAANLDWGSVGIWQATWKISEVYLGVISMALSTYFIPTLSALKTKLEINAEMRRTVIVVLPLTILCSLAVYFLRFIIIEILFTNEFNQASILFKYQLIGDVIKVLAWFYICLFISKGNAQIFIGIELFSFASFITLSMFLIQLMGIEGIALAYALNSFFVLIMCILGLNNIWNGGEF